VDISDGMLAVAGERLRQDGLDARVDLQRADAAKLDFLEADSLDGIFMSFTLELFDNPEIPRVLQECHRVLRPGGRVANVSMTKTTPPGMAVRIYEWFHVHMPDYADCRPIFARHALEQNGFAIQDVSVSSMWGLPVEILLGKRL
jgi:ubiquinone/menaquinone biosynthesis C-methylase UbiE